jgi:hypothetical protein
MSYEWNAGGGASACAAIAMVALTRTARRGIGLTLTLAVSGLVALGAWGCEADRGTGLRRTEPTGTADPVRSAAAPAPVRAARDLAEDEARGGHTLARHVGLTDDDLRTRLRRERRISAASTWTDRATAERVVYAAIAASADRVGRWAARTGRRPNLALDYRGRSGTPLGRSLVRGTRRAVECLDATVVLKWDVAHGDYFVLTAYPEARP